MADITKRVLANGTTTYRVRIRLRGAPIQSATFSSLTKAKLWAQSTEAAMREGRHFPTAESKKHTCGEMIDRYIKEVLPLKPKSLPKQTSQLLWWKEQIGHVLLAQLTPSLIAQQRDKLLAGTTYRHTQRSPATVIRYLAALSHVLTVAHEEWEWMAQSPMSKITRPKEPRGRVRFLSPEEREKLLQACKESASPFLLPIVVLALSTGMRQGEVLGLTWQDVDLERGRAVLHHTKNGERRLVTIAGMALSLLRELSQRRDPDHCLVFPGTDGIVPIRIRSAWDTAVRKAGLSDFRFHDLRHSAASYLAMSQATPSEIAEVLGHKTLQMVKRYAHLSEDHTSSLVARMNADLFHSPEENASSEVPSHETTTTSDPKRRCTKF